MVSGIAAAFLIPCCAAVRVFEEANLGENSSEGLYGKARPSPKLAVESAAMHKVELAEMKRILDSQGVKLPVERFDDTNAELLRFAASAGLLQVLQSLPMLLHAHRNYITINTFLYRLRPHQSSLSPFSCMASM